MDACVLSTIDTILLQLKICKICHFRSESETSERKCQSGLDDRSRKSM